MRRPVGSRASVAATLAGLALGLALGLASVSPAAAGPRQLRVVLANVGNVNVPGCSDQVFKLCLRPVEGRAAAALRALAPDVTALIEVLPAARCEAAPSTNPANLCSGPLEPPGQVTRLLGPGQDEACDARFGWDCLAARRARALRLGPLTTRPVVAPCTDAGFTLSTATLRAQGWPVTIAIAHPDSSDVPCRAAQVDDLLAALPARGPALVLGDFNLDPFREDDASVAAFRRGLDRGLRLLSGDAITSVPGAPSQLDPTGTTLDGPVALDAGPLRQRTIDHVLGRDGVEGTCEVVRVDGGGGMDHRAQSCAVTFAEAVAPRVRLRRRTDGCTYRAAFLPSPPWLEGVRFTLGARAVEDRVAPYELRLPAGTRRPRVVVQALLPGADGPRMPRRLRGC